ncbi:hypothetical protein BDZ45DRAFT_745604 [Acephala macrosclerotiorum]|nr:hypothetical protein BDZ45DRAFT_745604 [Acephala macrosclerotiorum]
MSQPLYMFPVGEIGSYAQPEDYFDLRQHDTWDALNDVIDKANNVAVENRSCTASDSNPAPPASPQAQPEVERETYIAKNGKIRKKNPQHKQRKEYGLPQVRLTEVELLAIRPGYIKTPNSTFAKHPERRYHRKRVTIVERDALEKHRIDNGEIINTQFGKLREEQQTPGYLAAQKLASERYEAILDGCWKSVWRIRGYAS